MIFGNIETIFKTHQNALAQLESIRNSWPLLSGVGTFFLGLAPELKCYGKYISNYQFSVGALERIKAENGNFTNFLHHATRLRKVDLYSLLTLPVNYIAQYVHVLSRFSAFDTETLPDHDALMQAYAILEKLNLVLQSELEKSANMASLEEVKRKLIVENQSLDLTQPNRVFAKEGTLIMTKDKKKKQKVHIFLFNDIVLITKHTSKGYRTKEVLDVADLTLHVVETDNVLTEQDSSQNQPRLQRSFSFSSASSRTKDVVPSFELHTPLHRVYHFASMDATKWISAFRKILESINNKKIVGSPLIDVLHREQSSKCFSSISSKNSKTQICSHWCSSFGRKFDFLFVRKRSRSRRVVSGVSINRRSRYAEKGG